MRSCKPGSRSNVGGDRSERVDDDLEAIGRKLAIYERRTAPLVEYYRRRGARIVTLDVTADMTPAQMWDALSISGKHVAIGAKHAAPSAPKFDAAELRSYNNSHHFHPHFRRPLLDAERIEPRGEQRAQAVGRGGHAEPDRLGHLQSLPHPPGNAGRQGVAAADRIVEQASCLLRPAADASR